MEASTSISKAQWVYAGLKHLWPRPDVSLTTKGLVCCAAVHAILLYGCETRSLHSEDTRHLEVFAHGYLSSIAGIGWCDRVSNAQVIDTGSENISLRLIRLSKLRGLGPVLRTADTFTVPCLIYNLPLCGKSHVEVNRWRGNVEWERVQRTGVKQSLHIFMGGPKDPLTRQLGRGRTSQRTVNSGDRHFLSNRSDWKYALLRSNHIPCWLI